MRLAPGDGDKRFHLTPEPRAKERFAHERQHRVRRFQPHRAAALEPVAYEAPIAKRHVPEAPRAHSLALAVHHDQVAQRVIEGDLEETVRKRVDPCAPCRHGTKNRRAAIAYQYVFIGVFQRVGDNRRHIPSSLRTATLGYDKKICRSVSHSRPNRAQLRNGHDKNVSDAPAPPGYQLDVGVKAQGSSRSISLMAGPGREILYGMLQARDRSGVRRDLVEHLLRGLGEATLRDVGSGDAGSEHARKESCTVLIATVRDSSWRSCVRSRALVELMRVLEDLSEGPSILLGLLHDLAAGVLAEDESGTLGLRLLEQLYPQHVGAEQF